MGEPVLIDTDMGVDDAVAVALAYSTRQIEVEAICSVGGAVDAQQAYRNVWRILGRLAPDGYPIVVVGHDPPGPAADRRGIYGEDGLGGANLPAIFPQPAGDLVETYERMIKGFGEELTIVAMGPLTNLAAVQRARPGLLEQAGRLILRGGAVWVKGDAPDRHAEFNFWRDAEAAAEILALSVPIRVVPLDMTRQIRLDESHLARLRKCARPAAASLGDMLAYPIGRANESPPGTCMIHDALAVSTMVWPELFLETELLLEVCRRGPQRGKTTPSLARGPARPLRVVVSVDGSDYTERLLEAICRESFVV